MTLFEWLYHLIGYLTNGFRMTSIDQLHHFTELYELLNGPAACGADLDNVNQFQYVIAYVLSIPFPC